jgi:hypothetical protein
MSATMRRRLLEAMRSDSGGRSFQGQRGLGSRIWGKFFDMICVIRLFVVRLCVSRFQVAMTKIDGLKQMRSLLYS